MFNTNDYINFIEWLRKKGREERCIEPVYMRDGNGFTKEFKECIRIHSTSEDLIEYSNKIGKECCGSLTIEFKNKLN